MIFERGWRRNSLRWPFSLAFPLLVVGIVSGCDEKEKKAKADRQEKIQSEIAKFATPDLARAEMERRLSKRLVRDGMTIIATDAEPFQTVYILPINTPWVVSCNLLGLWVRLGSDLSEHDSISIDIIPFGTSGELSAKKCREIAPILGNMMTIMTS